MSRRSSTETEGEKSFDFEDAICKSKCQIAQDVDFKILRPRLYQEGVFTKLQLDRAEAERCNFDQMAALLDLCPRLGQEQSRKFLEVLDVDFDHVSKQIRKDMKAISFQRNNGIKPPISSRQGILTHHNPLLFIPSSETMGHSEKGTINMNQQNNKCLRQESGVPHNEAASENQTRGNTLPQAMSDLQEVEEKFPDISQNLPRTDSQKPKGQDYLKTSNIAINPLEASQARLQLQHLSLDQKKLSQQDQGSPQQKQTQLLTNQTQQLTSQTLQKSKEQNRTTRIQPLTSNQSCLGKNVYQEMLLKKPGRIYRMDTMPRGLALIIDNIHFDHLSIRNWSDIDAKNLYDMFKYLGFQVSIERDKKAGEMLALLECFAAFENLGRVSALAVVILTHGGHSDIFFGTDGRLTSNGPNPETYISKVKLMQIFKQENCPAMQMKPKLFILQCCRGVEEDKYLEEPDTGSAESPPDQSGKSKLIAAMADMCFIHSSSLGYKAYRRRDRGSPFVETLKSCVMAHAKSMEFRSIIQEVQHVMKQQYLQSQNAKILSLPELTSYMSNDWFLNPPNI